MWLSCAHCTRVWEGAEAEGVVHCPEGHATPGAMARRRALLPGVRDPVAWRAFEEALPTEPPDFARALEEVTAMLEYARQLGRWPPSDPLEGIETDILLGRALNRVRTPP